MAIIRALSTLAIELLVCFLEHLVLSIDRFELKPQLETAAA
jgi:hypothetical protein